MELWAVLMLLILWPVICAGCGALGFFIGAKLRRREVQPRAAPEPTQRQKQIAKKRAMEVSNMLSYTGDIQDDISV